MRRSLARTLTLQTASLADDGIQVKPTWSGGTAFTVQLMPASKSDVELAGLRGERVTHTALCPHGITVTTDAHRFVEGSTVYRIASIVPAPKHTVVVLEATT